jgi:phenylacetaldehyde dehydrogenase
MDLQTAIAGAANAIFFNHGQCCSAGSRLYIEKPVFDQVVEGVAEQAKKIKLGPGFDATTQMGPSEPCPACASVVTVVLGKA